LEYGENTKDFKKNEQESIFFFLSEGSSVKAFGMLKPVGITHSGKHYQVLGLAILSRLKKVRATAKRSCSP